MQKRSHLIRFELKPGKSALEYTEILKRKHTELLTKNQNAILKVVLEEDTNTGLCDFYQQYPQTKFSCIRLQINFVEKNDNIRKNLETLFETLSQTDVIQFSIVNSYDDKNRLIELEPFLLDLTKRYSICFTIDLCEKRQVSSNQYDIDRQVAANQHKRDLEKLGKQASPPNEAVEYNYPKFTFSATYQNLTVEVEQEQQTNIVVTTEQQHNLEEQITNVDEIQGLDFNACMNYLLLKKHIRKEDSLKIESYLLTRYELYKWWHIIKGDIVYYDKEYSISKTENPLENKEFSIEKYKLLSHLKIIENHAFKTISKAALKQLLNHKALFQWGLEPSYLPQGFIIIENNNGNILHYIAKHQLGYSDIAPKLLESLVIRPLQNDIFVEIINHRDSEYVRQYYQKIVRNGQYQRQSLQALQTYLPELLAFSEEVIEKIIDLCTKDDQLDPKNLAYLLANYQSIAAIFSIDYYQEYDSDMLPYQRNSDPSFIKFDNYDNNLLAKSSIEQQFRGLIGNVIYTFKDRPDGVIELACQMALEVENSNVHPLVICLEHDDTLIAQFNYWNRRFDFSQSQKNALLRLYSDYSETGLTRLFALWQTVEEELLESLLAVYKTAVSWEAIILDNQLEEALTALKILKQANPNQYRWWQILLKQHIQTVGYDYLPNLVNAFKSFSSEISETYHLEFYDNPAFAEVKSLPLALARMLIILKNCKEEDRAYQWQCITALCLNSNGAVRACLPTQIDNNEIVQSSNIIVPQMKTEVITYNEDIRGSIYYYTHVYSHGYRVEKWQDIACSKDYFAAVKNFYRCIAFQPRQCSINFYQALEKIVSNTKFSLNTLARVLMDSNDKKDYHKTSKIELLALLTGMTVNPSNSETAESLLAQCKDIIQKLEDLTVDSLVINQAINFGRVALLKELNSLSSSPSYSIIKLYIVLFTDVYRSVINIEERDKVFQSKIKEMGHLVNQYGRCIYQGMKFYDEKVAQRFRHSNQSILEQHLSTVEAIVEKLKTNSAEKKLVQALLGVISTFNLIDQQSIVIDSIIASFLEAYNASSKKLLETFTLLEDLTDNQKLTAQSLIDFLNAIKQDTETVEPYKIVHQHFNTSFPADFFSENKIKERNAAFETFYNQHLVTNHQKNLMDKILSNADCQNPKSVVKIIDRIAKITDKKPEQLLTYLADLSFSSAEQLENLLQEMNQRNSLNQALIFLKRIDRKSLDTVLKLGCYLTEILPFINHLNFAIPRLDLYVLIINLLSILEVEDIKQIIPPKRLAIEELDDTKDKGKEKLEDREDLVVKSVQAVDKCLLTEIVQITNKLIHYYPGGRQAIINYLQYAVKANPINDNNIKQIEENLKKLAQTWLEIDDIDTVRALCYYFNGQGNNLRYNDLLDLVNHTSYQKHVPQDKCFFLKLLTSLYNSSKPCKLNDFVDLMVRCEAADTLAEIKNIYQAAPYPSLQELRVEFEKRDNLEVFKQQFDKVPYLRDKNNGFKLKKAYQQIKGIQGFRYTEEILDKIYTQTIEVRALSTDEIADLLKPVEPNRNLPSEQLIALAAELLYRTKSMPKVYNSEGKDISNPGRSFEINTTQYLALYSMLAHGEKVESQIGTGEGKSRIMMILAACKHAQGKTVDFVTSDLTLAERDYLTYKPYFDCLGALTNLIYQFTPAESYQKKGINFSDANNLNLFRNKAISEGKKDLVINPDASKRTLLLDEADRIILDSYQRRYNNSAAANEIMRDIPWLYETIIQYFIEENPSRKEYSKELFEAFKRYAFNKIKPEQITRLKNFSDKELYKQLFIWMEAASTALSLTFKKDFVIEKDSEILTNKGVESASKIQLLIDNGADNHSKLSYGVQQLLAARLNYLKERPARSTDNALKEQLADCKANFKIEEEKQIIYSSTVQSMLNIYKEGFIYATTGTAGSGLEQQEMEATRQLKTLIIPRHQGLHRVDYPLSLVKDKNAHYELIIEHIKKARGLNQPILIFCENDIESKALFNFLTNHYPEDPKLQIIDAQTKASEEKDHINHKAGCSGMVTVSTNKIGRGTDIELHDKAKEYGMRVLINYLPSNRDIEQMRGRSGRFGAKGQATIITSLDYLKNKWGGLANKFFTAPEAYIYRQQCLMEYQQQIERAIVNTVNAFRDEIKDKYFTQITENIAEDYDVKSKIDHWSKFSDEADKHWNTVWITIKNQLDEPDCAVAINELLTNYQQAVQRSLDEYPLFDEKPEVEPLKLSQHAQSILKEFDINTMAPLKTYVYQKYHPAHDGRAVLYQRSFTQWRAVWNGERILFANWHAWRSGHGILFANLRAYLNGHIGLKEYLFNFSKDNVFVTKKGRQIGSSLFKSVLTSEDATEQPKNQMKLE